MKQIFLVARHELITTISRRSFQLLSFGLPLLGLLIFMVVSLVKKDSSGIDGVPPIEQEALQFDVEGFVDQSGLIEVLPEGPPADYLVAFRTEAQARQALGAGEIAAFYIIPEDYVATGDLIYIHPGHTPLSFEDQDWIIRRTLMLNLLNGDIALMEKVWNPMNLEEVNLAPEPQGNRFDAEECPAPGPTCRSSVLGRMIPFIMVILLFLFITQSSSLLIRSISSEKQNYVIEIMMVSVSPRQFLSGKILGLGIAGFLSTLVWLFCGYTVLRFGGGLLNLPMGFTIPMSLVVWSVVFFLLGYALYASLMAGAGALVPSMKEITQATWLILMPLFIAYFIGITPMGLDAPHSSLVVGLSLFPLTAPIIMIMRLTIGGVPLWQALLSVGLMVGTFFIIIRAVASMFRAQTLLSGQPFSTKRFLGLLIRGA